MLHVVKIAWGFIFVLLHESNVLSRENIDALICPSNSGKMPTAIKQHSSKLYLWCNRRKVED